MDQDLFYLDATELVSLIQKRELSARDVMAAHLARIEQINPGLNAIVTLHAEEAMRAAAAADEEQTKVQAKGETLGALHGLPVAHKDLLLVRGMRTTFGSKVHEHFIPTRSTLAVERQQQAGAISIGKTNTPEFGAGAQTFNALFGATRNPYDPAKTCGGSSGGAAVALAAGMVPLADGSDMGGSLRCPANFCNVVGLRPSPGRVPVVPAQNAWGTLSVTGPMARTVADVALYLSVLAGPDARDPIAIAEDPARFRQALERDFKGVRIAFSADMGGLPMEKRVVDVIASRRGVFEDMGCQVDDVLPQFGDAHEAFMTMRAYSMELALGTVLDMHPGVLKDSLVWNIEEGRRLTASRLARAEKARTALFERMHRFMQQVDYLVLPVNQVAPFPIEQEYVAAIDTGSGIVKLDNYMEWLRSCTAITMTSHPAISVPCGFTADGLPVGLQIVGRHRDEFGLLQIAHAFEQRMRSIMGRRRPAL